MIFYNQEGLDRELTVHTAIMVFRLVIALMLGSVECVKISFFDEIECFFVEFSVLQIKISQTTLRMAWNGCGNSKDHIYIKLILVTKYFRLLFEKSRWMQSVIMLQFLKNC